MNSVLLLIASVLLIGCAGMQPKPASNKDSVNAYDRFLKTCLDAVGQACFERPEGKSEAGWKLCVFELGQQKCSPQATMPSQYRDAAPSRPRSVQCTQNFDGRGYTCTEE